MSFLVVGLVETGRMREAREILDRADRITSKASGSYKCGDEGRSVVLAAYMIETGEWERAKDIKADESDNSPIAGTIWMAVGLGAVRTGDTARADKAERRLVAMRDARSKLSGQTMDNSSETLRLAVTGWKAQQAGEKAEALRMLRKSADLQDRLESNYVIIKPVREMLADLLLLNGDQAAALVEYKAVLIQEPNRFNSLYGAGSAAFAAGDMPTAKFYYTQLISLAKGDERPELVTARSRMAEKMVAKAR